MSPLGGRRRCGIALATNTPAGDTARVPSESLRALGCVGGACSVTRVCKRPLKDRPSRWVPVGIDFGLVPKQRGSSLVAKVENPWQPIRRLLVYPGPLIWRGSRCRRRGLWRRRPCQTLWINPKDRVAANVGIEILEAPCCHNSTSYPVGGPARSSACCFRNPPGLRDAP